MKRPTLFPLLALILLIASLFPVTPARAATTFTVNATDDTDDSVCNATHCSLREAINAAEATPGTDTILFNLGPGIQTITLTSPLQSLEDVVIVDCADSDSEHTVIRHPIITLFSLYYSPDVTTYPPLVLSLRVAF